MKIDTLEKIIERIKEFRDKPKDKPLSKGECLIALWCYFEQQKERRKNLL